MRALTLFFIAVALLGCGKRKKGPAYKAVQISVGASSTCAAMADGSVRCWGELGDGKPLPDFSGASGVCAGRAFICAKTASGGRCHWPHPKSEQGMEGDIAVRGIACKDGDPVAITGADDARVAAGSTSSCIIKTDGTVRCTGEPEIAIDLSRVTDAVDVAVGGHHACVLHKDERLSCWGKNDHGQLGDGTRLDRNVPSLVSNLAGVKHVAAGANHTCIHRGDDTIRCWGSDSRRQLGLGGAAGDKDVPTLVPGLYEAINIAAGGDSTCALMTDGWLRCWGANEHGQLGDETDTDRAVPVPIRM